MDRRQRGQDRGGTSPRMPWHRPRCVGDLAEPRLWEVTRRRTSVSASPRSVRTSEPPAGTPSPVPPCLLDVGLLGQLVGDELRSCPVARCKSAGPRSARCRSGSRPASPCSPASPPPPDHGPVGDIVGEATTSASATFPATPHGGQRGRRPLRPLTPAGAARTTTRHTPPAGRMSKRHRRHDPGQRRGIAGADGQWGDGQWGVSHDVATRGPRRVDSS
jgi:hypothetical protein